MSRSPWKTVTSFALVLGVLALFAWATLRRIERIDAVTALALPSTIVDGRRLILPERSERSFHVIAQTQQMLATPGWRLSHVNYENAPAGHAVTGPSAYRWWLGSLASVWHRASGASLAGAVEDVARFADPLLFGLTLLVMSWFVLSRCGGVAAVGFAFGATTLFPLVTEFLPGLPDDRALGLVCALSSFLLLIAEVNVTDANAPAGGTRDAWFGWSGILGGIGLWVCAPVQAPLLIGTWAGALLVAALLPLSAAGWRSWGVSGGITLLALAFLDPALRPGATLASYLLPVCGLTWMAVAEAIVQVARRRSAPGGGTPAMSRLAVVVGVLAWIALAVAWIKSGGSLASHDLATARLARVADAPVAANFWTWLKHDRGASGWFWSAVLPLAVLVPSLWVVGRRSPSPRLRIQVGIGLAVLAVSLTMAAYALRGWALVDAAALGLFVLLLQSVRGTVAAPVRWGSAALLAVAGAFGAVRVWPARFDPAQSLLTTAEAEQVIERHLANWLAQHAAAPDAVVYAPPHPSLTLSYYGGLRAVGTHAPDNQSGFGATIMIAGATSLDAVQALLEAHAVRFLVVPSWDPFFDEFADLYLAPGSAPQGSLLVHELRRLNLPPWLRPLPYQMPPIGGLGHPWVLVFAVVDDQSPVVATSRLAEFLTEMGDAERAQAVGQALRKFPGNVGALAALAQVQALAGDNAGAGQTLAHVTSLVTSGGDRNLPWDRRVSVAIALGRADQIQLARLQTRRCLAEADTPKLKSLSTGALYNLLALARALDLKWPDPNLEQAALQLLPEDIRKGAAAAAP